jgi:hypothetical protein
MILQELALRLGLRRRKVPGLLLVLKACGLVRPIAKRFIGGVAATAKRDCCAAAKTVRFSLHIDEFDFPFDAQGTVIADRDFCRWHLFSNLRGAAARQTGALGRNVVPGFYL